MFKPGGWLRAAPFLPTLCGENVMRSRFLWENFWIILVTTVGARWCHLAVSVHLVTLTPRAAAGATTSSWGRFHSLTPAVLTMPIYFPWRILTLTLRYGLADWPEESGLGRPRPYTPLSWKRVWSSPSTMGTCIASLASNARG
jgi:hypothetical protein